MPRSKPGLPSLVRELNDSAALGYIMRVGVLVVLSGETSLGVGPGSPIAAAAVVEVLLGGEGASRRPGRGVGELVKATAPSERAIG